MLLLDFNSDSYPDFLLYGKSANEVVIHKGGRDLKFSKPQKKFFYYFISEIKPLNYKKGYGQIYLFISRPEKLAGLVSFTKYGTPQLLNQIEFDSHPTDLSIADINGDGKNEALVYGTNFNGISILRERDFILHEEKIVENKLFSEAAILDMDYDSFPDIVGYDLLNNSLYCYYNDQFGEFQELRELFPGNAISNLTSVDINSDDFADLLFTNNNRFEILFGDSVSSFENHKIIDFKFSPEKFVVDDFNQDKMKDIAFIHSGNNAVSIAFGVTKDQFSDPIYYMERESLVCGVGFSNGKSRALAVLAEEGKLYFTYNVSNFSEDFKISIGCRPDLISLFDYERSKNSMIFIDRSHMSAVFILNNNPKYFTSYYNHKISEYHNRVVSDNISSLTKTFCFYSDGGRLIELLQINFINNNVSNHILYVDHPIRDLVIGQTDDNRESIIYALSAPSGILKVSEFTQHGSKFRKTVFDSVAVNVKEAVFSTKYENSIYFLDEGAFEFKRVSGFDNPHIRTFLSVPQSLFMNQEGTSILFENLENVIHGRDRIISFTTIDGATTAYYFDGVKFKTISTNNIFPSGFLSAQLDITGQVWGTNKQNKSYYFNRLLKQLYQIGSDMKLRKVGFKGKVELERVNNYIVSTLSSRKEYFIYSDNSDKCVTIQVIK